MPLLAAADGVRRLDLSLAARYSDYSTFGGETTGKAGLRFQVNEQLLLRGTFAEGFRAPNIGELFGSVSGFDAVLTDPCSATAPGGRNANCDALGVPAGYVQPNPQISVQTGGNRELLPETARSSTAGFVWSPGFATGGRSERLDIGLSWYRHRVEGGIQAIDAQTQLNACVNTLSPLLCGGITRNALGAISGFSNFLTNIGVVDTRGYDVDVSWVLDGGDLGRFSIDWRNTFVDDYEAVGANGVRQPQGVGIEVSNSAIPELSSHLALGWGYGDFETSWTLRHVSDLTERCGNAASFEVCSDRRTPATASTNRLGSTTYHDLQLGWKAPWGESTRFVLGVNNVFSKEPPICLSCTLNGYDASTYDMPGSRFVYGRAEVRF